jgi:hypothetical protein
MISNSQIATAILGIDTLWGGDVMCLSGTGRFIADSWFSDEPLPPAYTHPTAAPLRASGGVSAKPPDIAGIDAYLDSIDIQGAITAVANGHTVYLQNLGDCLQVMWDLAQEMLGRGDRVPYERCVRASTGADPEPSNPLAKREQLRELLKEVGIHGDLLTAVDEWRQARLVNMNDLTSISASTVARFDSFSKFNLLTFLPKEMHAVPRANITFLPIKDAWFSGSMNYIGRARKPDGSPEYEANYEINASLAISVPEFDQLITHEVVPGHVTTFAYLQHLYRLGKVGFEATIQTMNTRAATLSEGIANNALLIACGVTEIPDLADRQEQIGLLLALLQDDAKNQSSYLTWKEDAPQADVARTLRQEYLVSEERAGKLSGAWGRHPLLGRMYLPAYRAGTERVAELRRKYPENRVLPALYGCNGLVDITTVEYVV